MEMKDCCICEEISSKRFPYSKEYGITNRIIFENESFVAVPSVSPLSQGHTLIFTRRHFNNFLQVPEYKVIEAYSLTKYLYIEFLREMGDYLIFEHGVPNSHEVTCGINHAHLHLLPISSSIKATLLRKIQSDFHVEKFNSIQALHKYGSEIPSQYMMLFDGKSEYMIATEDNFESQLIRKLISEELGSEFWDWGKLYGYEDFQASLKMLHVGQLNPL